MQQHILRRGNPLLEQICAPVTDWTEARRVANDLWDTLIASQGLYRFMRGSGISAPQIGELQRISAIEFAGQRHTLVNPVVADRSEDRVLVTEGCLSFFDWRGRVLRHAGVVVEALDLEGTPISLSSDGNLDLSSLLQHELDHLDGHLYTDRMPDGERLMYRENMPEMP